MNVAIVGCGLIGKKRAAALASDRLTIVADVVADRARELAEAYQCRWTADCRDVVDDPSVDIVNVCTINKFLHPISVAALAAGKHVLCEKPLGRNASEAEEMVAAAKASRRVLKTGFNHRHHPAIQRAHDEVRAGRIGDLMFVRCVYGHGGRMGYEREWRANRDLAGGGELLDQGVHVIDLCRWFLGDFVRVTGVTRRFVWDIAPVEDNGFALLEGVDGRIASIHTSWTQWRNRFTFEVFGTRGHVIVEGLGGSYGPESLTVGTRRPEGGAPMEEVVTYPADDRSWVSEWQEFRRAIDTGVEPIGSGADGLAAARVIDALYRSAENGGVPVPIESPTIATTLQ